jgi:hypothetical protein
MVSQKIHYHDRYEQFIVVTAQLELTETLRSNFESILYKVYKGHIHFVFDNAIN